MVTPSPELVRRRVEIDFNLENDLRWTSGAAYFEDILNVVSYFFPVGEKYFINSIQSFTDQITDPILKQKAKDFIYQEAMHTKQHARSNEVLNSIHSYGPVIEKISDFFLVKTLWFTPKVTQLAITCALEHFTALLADYLLRRLESFTANSNESFGSLWAWHAVEETEHKAVCFDVYQHIFGNGVFSYLNRIFAMALTTICFLIAILIGLFILQKEQRRVLKTRREEILIQPKDSTRPNKKNPYGQFWRLIKKSLEPKLYFNYYRPSFHPWDHDNSHLIEHWKQAYPNSLAKNKLTTELDTERDFKT